MDTVALVDNQIDDARRLLDRLDEEGVVVRAAFWLKPVEEDRWSLYIATPLVDEQGVNAAYRQVYQALQALDVTWLTHSDIKLVGEKSRLAQEVIELLRRNPGPMVTRSRRPLLGGTPIEEVYVYPSKRSAPHTELTEVQKDLLQGLYSRTNLSVDDLPYTDVMDQIHQDFVEQTGLRLSVRDVFKALKNLGRQGRLGGKIRPQPTAEEPAAAPPKPAD